MQALDYKKVFKNIYSPKAVAECIDMPKMTYVAVDGQGDPNTSLDYKEAIEIVYSLSYAIKMSKKSNEEPDGYFDYVVPPLEGLWWGDDGYFNGVEIVDKSMFSWRSMIRLPEFVTREYFEDLKQKVALKKPNIAIDKAQYFEYEEGLCVQVLHVGPYDEEPASVAKINQYIENHNLLHDMADQRHHHEIYLSDPRRVAKEKLKTIIRHPVKSK